MSAVAKRLLTPAEYLAIERKAEYKSEFYRGEMFAMAGARYEHNAVKDNLFGNYFERLKGGPCRPISSDMKVKVSRTGLYTYPDLILVCGEMAFEDENHDVLLNPQVIFEVLSDSTEKYDRGKKFLHYRRVESLREYVLVAQDQPLLERYLRQPDGSWELTEFSDPNGDFTLATIPARIPLSAVYTGVELPETPPR
jgi:Uma2 family endonuclease